MPGKTLEPLARDGSQAARALFAGPGDLRVRCRAHDWGATPLGPVESWPPTLRVAAQMVLAAGLPNILLWGRELTQLYNDPYATIIRGKHPHALGRGNREVWPEVWHINGPIYERVFAGETVVLEDALYPLERGAGAHEREDAYLTVAFSPVLDEAGDVVAVLANMLETTSQVERRRLQEERERALAEARASREHLARVISQAPVSMYIARGREHVYEVVNDAWLHIVRKREEEVVGRSMRALFPEVGRQGIYELVERVWDGGEALHHPAQRIELVDDAGTVREHFFNIVYQPLRDGTGAVYAMAVVATDVTELAQARRDAEQARAAAEGANRAKSDFLAVMSHELRTPLNAIGGYAELLELGIHGPVTPAQHTALDRIRQSQRHLLGLINEVLNYARLETGTVHYAVQEVPLVEALAEAVGLVAPQAAARGLALAVAACEGRPVARADCEKVRQVLVNLLSNAVKFTDRGGEVTLSCASDAGQVRVTVRDTGIGIAADKLAAIFEPFVQVRADLTRTAEGTGLGLAISRDLARGMGGDLTVASVPGEGSAFTLLLPRA